MLDEGGPPAPVIDRAVAEAALAGLKASPKTLPPKLFYDEEGCRLFYRITELPEYYLTRAEGEPLAAAAAHLGSSLAPGTALVEYGASSEEKARRLLDVRNGERMLFSHYIPVDVAAPALAALQRRVAALYPDLAVQPVVADFTARVALPEVTSTRPCLAFFPGSTIGNLEPAQAEAFMRQVRASLGREARFLLGADLRKDASILVPAYDDAAGVTAAFNLNLLLRLNREAGADFDPTRFSHRAIWNERESRIEMHLVSRDVQTAHIAGVPIHFDRGETIHTENSYKHAPDRMIAIAAAGGWRNDRIWTDSDGLFAVYLFSGT
jgi:dimethylhistidine N-methyltransferase